MSKLYDVFPSFPLPSSLNTTSPSPSIRHLLPPALQSVMLLSYPIRQTRPPSLPASPISSPAGTTTTTTTLYGKGPADAAFVLFCALGFTVARELIMRYLLGGFARWYLSTSAGKPPGGWKGKKARRRREHIVVRFAEQGWSFLYCTCSWTLGTYILSLLPSPLSPQSLWGTYPNTPIPQLTKFYYLAQLGWWFHQIYVINTEKRRHDHWQMFSHHILTIALVGGSYISNFTRVGTVIHVLMDFCDIWLPLAKMFRYLSFITLCDSTFVLFLISWLITRQVGLGYMIYTSWVHAPQLIEYRWNPATEQYMSKTALNIFIGMEIVLLGLASMWFYMALRVALRVVRGQGAEDVRSDEEDEVDGEEGEGEKGGLMIDVRDEEGASSGESSPALTATSSSGGEVGTPKGVESLTVGDREGTVGVGVGVPEVLKGLQCKRDFREEGGGARRRK